MLRNSHADGDSHAGLSEPSWPIRALRRRSLFATKRRWRKTVSVLDLEKVAHEGDIVLFAGTGGGDSRLSCILGHEYTHCAIVVKGCPTEGSTEQQLCIMESVIEGVGLVPLQGASIRQPKTARANRPSIVGPTVGPAWRLDTAATGNAASAWIAEDAASAGAPAGLGNGRRVGIWIAWPA